MDKFARIIPLGGDLLKIADIFVETKNIEGLRLLDTVISKLIIQGDIVDEAVSLIEIGEYAGEALDRFGDGEAPAEVKNSSIRRLLNE